MDRHPPSTEHQDEETMDIDAAQRDGLPQGSVRVLASPAAWSGAASGVAAAAAVMGATGWWLWGMVSSGDVLAAVDSTTWLLVGLAASFSWRVALLVCMASGALWSRARGAGHDLGARRLVGRVAERAWLLAKLAAGWAVWSRVLGWLGRRSRWLGWLARIGRASVATSTVAGVVACAKRELPDSAGDAKRIGRTLVGGRWVVAINLVLVAAGAVPLVGASVAAGWWQVPLPPTVLGVASAVVVLVASCGFGMVAGARLWNVADRRGRRHAARQRSWWRR